MTRSLVACACACARVHACSCVEAPRRHSGINSAVIKLGKLTEANKVYRGISGMALPKEFWEANEFGVRGGVETAFMSTTTDRSVAMGYASGAASGMGIVIEVQQGMVNRGADLTTLSQYPHESECVHTLPPLFRITSLLPPSCLQCTVAERAALRSLVVGPSLGR